MKRSHQKQIYVFMMHILDLDFFNLLYNCLIKRNILGWFLSTLEEVENLMYQWNQQRFVQQTLQVLTTPSLCHGALCLCTLITERCSDEFTCRACRTEQPDCERHWRSDYRSCSANLWWRQRMRAWMLFRFKTSWQAFGRKKRFVRLPHGGC